MTDEERARYMLALKKGHERVFGLTNCKVYVRRADPTVYVITGDRDGEPLEYSWQPADPECPRLPICERHSLEWQDAP